MQTYNYEQLLEQWIRLKILDQNGYNFSYIDHHEKEYNCKVTISNVRFGTETSGSCPTCEHTYSAIFYDVNCECPTKVPSTKNPQKMRRNPNRLNYKNMELTHINSKDYKTGHFSLSLILKEILELESD